MILKRIFASVLILVLILIAPYWMYLPAIFICMLIIPFFWEAVPFGMLIDTLYSPWPLLHFPPFPIALSALALLLILPLVRSRLRFNA